MITLFIAAWLSVAPSAPTPPKPEVKVQHLEGLPGRRIKFTVYEVDESDFDDDQMYAIPQFSAQQFARKSNYKRRGFRSSANHQ